MEKSGQGLTEKMETGYAPEKLTDAAYRYDSFENGKQLWNKKKDHLPAMGWNSWNAFGSGNTEALTKQMADAMVELGLDTLGYRYLVLDDGCYHPVRVDGKLKNEPGKFPGGFRELGEYIHKKGLKFGMYNDIGTNLCAGAAVGTCGHEDVDAASYVEWGVDFLKVDNCYYLFDDATFSDKKNARYTYAPKIRSITVSEEGILQEDTAADDGAVTFSVLKDGLLRGNGAKIENDYVFGIGTFDGTGPEHTPAGELCSELVFKITVPKTGVYGLTVEYATGEEPGIGRWLQVAVGDSAASPLYYDDFLPATASTEEFEVSPVIRIELQEGENLLRLMNHRRQENTLCSYAKLLEGLKKAAPDHDILLSLCEWGKTQPQHWGYKVGDSWRILNDITFRVGADGDPGHGCWSDDYTASVTSQYNKAVIMDEFAGLTKGWNDPDMMMIGINGLTETMYKTHMTMWCMMNSPLMLGLDLRRVKKGDALYTIIANKELIAVNQDALGVQAKRVYCSKCDGAPDKEYIRDNDRADILAKPLADGSIAVSFINVSETHPAENLKISLGCILSAIGKKLPEAQQWNGAVNFTVTDLWTKETWAQDSAEFSVEKLEPCDSRTIRIWIRR